MIEQLFTLEGYRQLIEAFRARGYKTVSFDEVKPDACHLVLRHDVDMCLDRAVQLAAVEAELGVTSSYFILVRTEMYAVTSARSRRALQSLRQLGREVGLHFDAAGLGQTPIELDEACAEDCRLLEALVGADVRTVSFHRPTTSLQGWPHRIAGRTHAYEPRFFRDVGYCSDSEGRFRFGHPLDHEAVVANRALQLVTHPIWWVAAAANESVLEKLERFRGDRDAVLGEELAANCKPYRTSRRHAPLGR
jgi:hypothetical protein